MGGTKNFLHIIQRCSFIAFLAKVIECENLITTKIDKPVKLRSVPGSEESTLEPLTVHELFVRTVRQASTLPALGMEC